MHCVDVPRFPFSPHCVCVCAHQYLGVLTALEAGWILLGFPGELRKQMDEVSRLYIDTKGAETQTMDTGRTHCTGIGKAQSPGACMGICLHIVFASQ